MIESISTTVLVKGVSYFNINISISIDVEGLMSFPHLLPLKHFIDQKVEGTGT
jgi:hypothetical protein